MVPDKRTITAACGLLAAATLALAACAPSGYGDDAAGGSDAAPALANATGTPDAAPSDDPTGSPDDTGSDVDVTSLAGFTESLTATNNKRMGTVVTNDDGFVLYRFDKDETDPPKSNCVDDCEKVWPPVLTDGNPEIEGISPDLVGTVTREDGTRQVTINDWPVYTYIGDKKAGQWTGQGVGGVWWVIDENGKKNLTCVPTSTPTAVKPPADDSSSDSGDSGYSY